MPDSFLVAIRTWTILKPMRCTSDREAFSPLVMAGLPASNQAPSDSALKSSEHSNATPYVRAGVLASTFTAISLAAWTFSQTFLTNPRDLSEPPLSPISSRQVLSGAALAEYSTGRIALSPENEPELLAKYQLPQLASAHPVQPMIMMGGGEFHPDIADLISAWSKDILVIAWASSIPDEYFASAEKILKAAGANRVIRMPDIDQLKEDEAFELLKGVQGVFLTGGKQIQLEDRLAQTGIGAEIVRRLREDSLLIAGTSAGCAVASSMMIAGSGEAPESTADRQFIQLPSAHLTKGSGFINYPVIVDQHFSQRNRMLRLEEALNALGTNIRWGIGVDEATAAVLIDNRFLLVAGKNTVTILPGRGAPEGFEALTLKSGEVFDMHLGVRFEGVHGTEVARSSVWRWSDVTIK